MFLLSSVLLTICFWPKNGSNNLSGCKLKHNTIDVFDFTAEVLPWQGMCQHSSWTFKIWHKVGVSYKATDLHVKENNIDVKCIVCCVLGELL